jgi:hypothetical protein
MNINNIDFGDHVMETVQKTSFVVKIKEGVLDKTSE